MHTCSLRRPPAGAQVFDALKYQLVPGTLLVFDELVGFAGFERYEFRALFEAERDYLSPRGLGVEWIEWWGGEQAALVVTDRPAFRMMNK